MQERLRRSHPIAGIRTGQLVRQVQSLLATVE
jgi:hypothetical protein